MTSSKLSSNYVMSRQKKPAFASVLVLGLFLASGSIASDVGTCSVETAMRDNLLAMKFVPPIFEYHEATKRHPRHGTEWLHYVEFTQGQLEDLKIGPARHKSLEIDEEMKRELTSAYLSSGEEQTISALGGVAATLSGAGAAIGIASTVLPAAYFELLDASDVREKISIGDRLVQFEEYLHDEAKIRRALVLRSGEEAFTLVRAECPINDSRR